MDYEMASALAGDAGPAGVHWLLTGDEPQRALRDAIAAQLADPALLLGCRLHRAKYKPGRHLTAYYEVTVRAPASGAEETRHVEATWRPPGTPLRGAPPDSAALDEEARARGISAPFLRLTAEDTARGLRLRVSPLDAEFPQLVRLSDPAYASELLAEAAGRRATNGGYRVDVVRYRPGQRHVLRYDPARGAAPGEGTLFAKIYNGDKGRRTFAVVGAIATWLAKRGGQIGTVLPAAYLASEQTVLYPWVAGAPLSQLLRTPGPAVDAQIALAGAALRELHRTPIDLVELQPHSLAQELKTTASASEHIRTLLPEVGVRIAALLERARALHDRLPQEAPGFAYGDYKSDHLWVTPGALTLIDFDTCYLFDPAIDIGKFLSDLRWWHDHFGLPDVDRAQARFLGGYDVSPDRLARARLYEVLVLAKTTARRVRLFDADWADRTGRLIATAERLLGELAAGA